MARTVLGIDEAGRGAVLGPLVLAGVLFEDDDDIFEALAAAGVCDSKLATSERRGELARVVRKLKARHVTYKIDPRLIDEQSVNELEIAYSARLIGRLKPAVVYLDVPASGTGVRNYCESIRQSCSGHACEIRGGNKFDRANLVVAAASIVAKEEREAAVKKLRKIYGDFGSGYPHDPRTRSWLAAWRRGGEEWPEIVRRKWSTVASL